MPKSKPIVVWDADGGNRREFPTALDVQVAKLYTPRFRDHRPHRYLVNGMNPYWIQFKHQRSFMLPNYFILYVGSSA
jgi:hypothetical protein